MNKRIVIVLVMLMVFVGSAFPAATPVTAAVGPKIPSEILTCADLNFTETEFPVIFAPVFLEQGQTVLFSATVLASGAQQVLLVATAYDAPIFLGPEPVGTMSYTAPAEGAYLLMYSVGAEEEGSFILSVSCGSAPVAGCDAFMDIPATAVGGTFVADAPVFWAPGELTDIVITTGNSARVLGVDASGVYYKIIWVCDYLWVPVSSMGPNYDAVWNGAPLPTDVVE